MFITLIAGYTIRYLDYKKMDNFIIFFSFDISYLSNRNGEKEEELTMVAK